LAFQSILNRNGLAPARTSGAKKDAIDSTLSSFEYEIDGWGMAPSSDLGYVYGTITRNGKSDNYLRIWRREKTGWKIAFEVLKY
jgi:hypothetical protein